MKNEFKEPDFDVQAKNIDSKLDDLIDDINYIQHAHDNDDWYFPSLEEAITYIGRAQEALQQFYKEDLKDFDDGTFKRNLF